MLYSFLDTIYIEELSNKSLSEPSIPISNVWFQLLKMKFTLSLLIIASQAAAVFGAAVSEAAAEVSSYS